MVCVSFVETQVSVTLFLAMVCGGFIEKPFPG